MDVREKLVEIEQAAIWFEDRAKITPMPGARRMFELAGAALREKANGVTVQGWISVNDRLPDKREDVLLCRKWWNEIRNPQMGWYNEVSQSWFDLSNREIRNVTHWMPLPVPPKGE